MNLSNLREVMSVTGESGRKYELKMYKLDENTERLHDMCPEFPDVGGIYIFIKQYKDTNYRDLIYCGKTENLSNRFYDHHKEDDIIEENPNYICIMRVNTDEERTLIEEDILGGNDFTCNEMLN